VGFAIAVAATKEFETKDPKPAEREPGEDDEASPNYSVRPF
jgi:hypothetical protein